MARYKLVSSKGTLLGEISCPDHWVDYLKKRGGVTGYCFPPLPVGDWLTRREEIAPAVEIKTFYITPHYGEIRNAVELRGISIEEFEKQPECSFSPSMTYLRSQLIPND